MTPLTTKNTAAPPMGRLPMAVRAVSVRLAPTGALELGGVRLIAVGLSVGRGVGVGLGVGAGVGDALGLGLGVGVGVGAAIHVIVEVTQICPTAPAVHALTVSVPERSGPVYEKEHRAGVPMVMHDPVALLAPVTVNDTVAPLNEASPADVHVVSV